MGFVLRKFSGALIFLAEMEELFNISSKADACFRLVEFPTLGSKVESNE